jgi:HAD superfamily hydrolase (TIGR01509 family)
MIKAFIFDMDGVIIDSEPFHYEFQLATMKAFGIDIPKEEFDQFTGMTNPEIWSILKKEYNLAPSVEEIIEQQLNQKLAYLKDLQIGPIDGILELLQDLRRNHIAIALASSSPIRFIEAVLDKFNIRDYYDCVISGEVVGKGKPHPEIFLKTARELGVSPEHCMVLEDSRNGTIAAKSAGMRCIGFANPNSGLQDLSAADVIVNSIREINVQDWGLGTGVTG